MLSCAAAGSLAPALPAAKVLSQPPQYWRLISATLAFADLLRQRWHRHLLSVPALGGGWSTGTGTGRICLCTSSACREGPHCSCPRRLQPCTFVACPAAPWRSLSHSYSRMHHPDPDCLTIASASPHLCVLNLISLGLTVAPDQPRRYTCTSACPAIPPRPHHVRAGLLTPAGSSVRARGTTDEQQIIDGRHLWRLACRQPGRAAIRLLRKCRHRSLPSDGL